MPITRRHLTAGLMAVATSVALATGAFASGGADSGGSGGGGTGGGGGGGGGGGTTTTTTSPAPSSCVSITAFSNSIGYYSIWAAIWTSYGYTSSCGSAVSWRMTYLNNNTGAVDFSAAGTVMNATVDEDWAAFSTPYTVTLTVSDSSGNVLASTSALVTTKAPKTGA